MIIDSFGRVGLWYQIGIVELVFSLGWNSDCKSWPILFSVVKIQPCTRFVYRCVCVCVLPGHIWFCCVGLGLLGLQDCANWGEEKVGFFSIRNGK